MSYLVTSIASLSLAHIKESFRHWSPHGCFLWLPDSELSFFPQISPLRPQGGWNTESWGTYRAFESGHLADPLPPPPSALRPPPPPPPTPLPCCQKPTCPYHRCLHRFPHGPHHHPHRHRYLHRHDPGGHCLPQHCDQNSFTCDYRFLQTLLTYSLHCQKLSRSFWGSWTSLDLKALSTTAWSSLSRATEGNA